MVNEMVRRIRNPLNALLLNIDNLEDEIAEVDVETSRERLRRMRNTIAELDSLLCEVLRLSELPKPRITAVERQRARQGCGNFCQTRVIEKGIDRKHKSSR